MNPYRWVRIILLAIIVAPIAIFIFGGVVMLLWNNALVPVLHISEVTFWQALGILVLAKILFGHFGSGSASNRFYRKQRMMWNSMTPEQREKFKDEWRSRSRKWGYRDTETDTEQSSSGM